MMATDIFAHDPRQTLERLFNDSLYRTPSRLFDEGTLAVDISEHDGELLVKASLPGFEPEDIDVRVNEGVLSNKAQHSEEHEEQGERFYRHERSYGSVSRRIALPGIVRDAEVEAALKSGVLTLRIPLPEKAQPKQIDIKVAD